MKKLISRFPKRRRLLKLIISTLIVLVLAITLLLVFQKDTTEAAWHKDGWSYRKKFVIDNSQISGSSDFTDFPVLVNLTDDTDLRDRAQSDGDDITFVSADGVVLAHEIESYNSADADLVAWVRLPHLLVSGPNVFYMYYGNPSVSSQQNAEAVWNDEFEMVQHLQETSGTHLDSTANNIDSTSVSVTTQGSAVGQINGSDDFENGSSNFINLGDLNYGVSAFTISTWFRVESFVASTDERIVSKATGSAEANHYWMLGLTDTGGNERIRSRIKIDGTTFTDVATSGNLSVDTWYHAALVFDGTGLNGTTTLYLNGSNVGGRGSIGNTVSTTTADVNIGRNPGSNDSYFDGMLDEVRIVTAARSTDWMTTEFNNQNSPSTFYSVDSQETTPQPVAWWKFDAGTDNTCSGGTNDACDASGKGNDGAINNGTAWQREDLCFSGKCLFFDGSNDNILVTNNSSIDFNEGLAVSHTIQAWIRPVSDGENDQGRIFFKGVNSYMRIFNEGSDGLADIEAKLDLDGLDATATATNAITINQWHHVAVTYTDDADDDTTLYVDGVVVATGNGGGSPVADANDLYIGNNITGDATFNGFIDDFKIYPYERTAAQTLSDMQQGTASSGVGTSFASRQSYLSNGLVGYWQLNHASGNAVDSSGNGHTLTNTNTVAYVNGKFGNAGDFERDSSEYFFIADQAKLSLTSDLTMAAWINPESTTASTAFDIMSKWDSGAESYAFVQFGDELRFYADSDSNYETTDSVNLTAGTWYHVAVTYDAVNAKVTLFVNGSPVASTTTGTIPTSLTDETSRFHIGAEDSAGTPDNFYDGLVDEARIYKRKLSTTDIVHLYQWAPGPVAYWPLNENTGTTSVFDISTNANTATMTGTMTAEDWVPGQFGSALDFDGSNDALTVAAASDAHLDFNGTEAFSGSAWVYVKTMPGSGNQDAIITKWDETSALRAYRLVVENDDADATGNFQVEIYDESVNQAITASGSNDTVSQNTWYHVAFTFNGGVAGAAGDLRLYTDGSLTASNAQNTSFLGLEDVAADFSIADYDVTDTEANNTALTGIIDDPHIYNYVRTQGQIIQDLNGGHPAPGSPITSKVFHLKFDEAYGNIANDATSNGLFGDLGGGDSCPGSSTCATWTNEGKYGYALDYDGGDLTWMTASSEYDNGGTEHVTQTLWFKSSTNPTNNYGLMGVFGDGTNTQDRFLQVTSAGLPRFYAFNGAEVYATGTTVVTDGEWHHLAGVFDGSYIHIYVDGILEASAATSTTQDHTGVITMIFSPLITSYYDRVVGTIDDAKYYNIALTSEQIALDMNNISTASLGVLGTDNSGGSSNASGRAYCPPGDTTVNCAPVAHYKLDENTGTTAFDTSENAFNATLTGDATNWSPGKHGSAINFGASNDYLIYDDNSVSALDLLDFTVSLWVKFDSLAADTTLAFKMGSANNQDNYGLYTNGSLSDELVCQYYDSGFEQVETTDADLTTNTWYHITCTFDSSAETLTLYVNGIQKAQTTGHTNNTPGTGDGDLFIGGNNLAWAADLDGSIDDVQIYNYPLSTAQVAWNYNRGGPIGWWKFDECAGSTAYDSSGNGNNGTITVGASGDYTSTGNCSSGTSTEAWNAGTTGKRSYALGLDGTDDYVEIPDGDLFSTNTFSVAAWVYRTGTGGADLDHIVDNRDANNDGWDLFFETSSTDPLTCGYNDTDVISTGYNFQSQDQVEVWNHVVCTSDGTMLRLYINGVENNSVAISGDISESTNARIGGRSFSTVSGELEALIDDVRIYNYALTPEQIVTVMNNGTVFFGPVTGNP